MERVEMFINLISPAGSLGYGVAGYNILKTLSKRGHAVAYFPLGNPTWEDDPDFNKLIESTRNRAKFYDPDAPSIRIWHQFALDMFPGRGQRIGFPIFELNKFNEVEQHHLSSLDKIFVTSEWAKEVIASNQIDVETHVVPLGVDPDIFYRDEEERNSNYWTKQRTIFINVGKWEKRKGHDELCEAFSKAFTPEDEVELWMINHNPFLGPLNEEWKRKYIESPMGANIRIFPRVSTQNELRKIFNQVDFGVFASRAEGWNLEILELMACGAHIIATNYSGHTEYLTEDNALLLEPTGMESANDGKWFFGQGDWCTFSVDDLVEKLRHVHELKKTGQLNPINEMGLRTAKQFSWDNTVSAIEGAV